MNLDANSTTLEGFELTFWFKALCTSPLLNMTAYPFANMMVHPDGGGVDEY
jgi:hypothetical protein